MKTTVDIPDSLFQEAKACAESRGVPFRQIVEEGLRAAIQRDRPAHRGFRLRDGSFAGKGLHKDFAWEDLRRAIYPGRGE